MEYRTTMIFKEIEYLASLKAVSDILTVSLVDAKNSSTWIGSFTSKAIEKLSAKAGSEKTFSVFCKLLYTAFQGKNQDLHLDFYSYQDLECIRNRMPLTTSLNPSQKKYLIISYITDFDKIHYPLPLIIEDTEQIYEKPNPNNEFSGENARLKHENTELMLNLTRYEEEFLSYKAKTEQEIRDITRIKRQLEEESIMLKGELDAIIAQLEKKTLKSKEKEKNTRSKALSREKQENLLLRNELENCRKEIEVLRKADVSNKQLIDILREKIDNGEEERVLDSPVSDESPITSPFKHLNSRLVHSEDKSNLLSEFNSKLSQMQNLIKKNKP